MCIRERVGWRIEEGVCLGRHGRLSGNDIAPARIEALVADGLLVREGDIVRASAEGRMVLDAVLARLLA